MNDMVEIRDNEPLTNTLTMSKGLKLAHNSVMKLVDKYIDRLEARGTLGFEIRKSGGRPVRIAWLNESQFLFLATLMRNSETVLDFKDVLTREFMRQKAVIAHLFTQRKNAEWIEQRDQTKVSRLAETDTIKEFIKYSKDQGSSSAADYYYKNITNMENEALFILEQRYPNVRDVLSGQQLQIIAMADLTVRKALQFGMEKNMPYRQIYELAKSRIMSFADLVGRTPVPVLDLPAAPRHLSEKELYFEDNVPTLFS